MKSFDRSAPGSNNKMEKTENAGDDEEEENEEAAEQDPEDGLNRRPDALYRHCKKAPWYKRFYTFRDFINMQSDYFSRIDSQANSLVESLQNVKYLLNFNSISSGRDTGENTAIVPSLDDAKIVQPTCPSKREEAAAIKVTSEQADLNMNTGSNQKACLKQPEYLWASKKIELAHQQHTNLLATWTIMESDYAKLKKRLADVGAALGFPEVTDETFMNRPEVSEINLAGGGLENDSSAARKCINHADIMEARSNLSEAEKHARDLVIATKELMETKSQATIGGMEICGLISSTKPVTSNTAIS